MERSLLLVDGHPWVAEALALLARRRGWSPVHVAIGTEVGRARAAQLRPHVVCLDLVVGEEPARDLLRVLRRDLPHTAVVVLAPEHDAQQALSFLEAGAAAYVPRSTEPYEVLAALDAAGDGHTWLPLSLIGPVLDGALHPPPPTEWEELVGCLSDRELEVLRLMVAGLDRQAIARELTISFNTVRTHFRNVLAKLGAHSSLEAVSVALRAGLRPPDQVEPG